MATATASNVTVALDIGSSRSAWAFSIHGCAQESIDVRVPEGALTSVSSDTKTDTAVLLSTKPPHRVEAFGRAAVELFIERSEKTKTRFDWVSKTSDNVGGALVSEPAGLLFRWFHRGLWKSGGYQSIDDPVATAVGGHRLPLMTVMVAVLRHFKEDVLKYFSSVFSVPQSIDDVLWVITVPAIYDKFSKAFMSMASHKAGLVDELDSPRLQLCLASEAAFHAVMSHEVVPVLNDADTTVMILDCGGDSVDITIHNITSVDAARTVGEVLFSTRGLKGSLCVDEEFTRFIRQFVGDEAYASVRYTSGFYKLLAKWEKKKTDFGGGPDERIRLDTSVLRRSLDLGRTGLKELCDAHNSRNSVDPHLHIFRSGSSISLPSALVRSFFAPTISTTTTCLRNLKRNASMTGLKCAFLVGGFSSSRLIQEVARHELERDGCTVVPALAPETTTLEGAVLCAERNGVFKTRTTGLAIGDFSEEDIEWNDPDRARQKAAIPFSNQSEEKSTTVLPRPMCVDEVDEESKSGQPNATCSNVEKEEPMGACDSHLERVLELQLATVEQECSKAIRMLADEPRQRVRMEVYIAQLNRDLREEKQQHQKTEERLVQVQQELEGATVRLKKEQHEKEEISQDRDRYRDQTNRRLLAQGTDIQAAFSTTFEVKARIEWALTNTVSDWFEFEEAGLRRRNSAASVRRTIPGLFLQCQAYVKRRQKQHSDFFLGGPAAVKAGDVRDMGHETVDFMRKHLRLHHRTLFPLTGDQLDEACKSIIEALRLWVARDGAKFSIRLEAVTSPPPRMANVIKEYLNILVASILQNPPVVFSDDCGMEQPFDSKVHYQPIDGDAIQDGDRCIVVFPCMMEEAEDGSGLKPLTKKFILSAVV